MQVRLYLNKKSSNTTEFRGNFTVGVPFDDSLIVSSFKKYDNMLACNGTV